MAFLLLFILETNSSLRGPGEWRSVLPSVDGAIAGDWPSGRLWIHATSRRRARFPGYPRKESQTLKDSASFTWPSTALVTRGFSGHTHSVNGSHRLEQSLLSGLGN